MEEVDVLIVCELGEYIGRPKASLVCVLTRFFAIYRIIRAFLVEEAKIVKAVLASQKQKK